MHLGQLRGGLDLLLAGAGPAIADVVANGVIEQHGVLGHDTDRRAQAVLGDVTDVLAVNQDAAVGNVVEPEQQPVDGRFSRPGGTDDRQLAASRDSEADALQDFPVGLIAEMHVLEDNLAGRPFRQVRGQRDSVGLVGEFLRDSQQGEHLLHVHQSLLDGHVNDPQEVQRLIQLDQIGVHHNELAHRHAARAHVGRSQQHDQGAR